MSSADLATATLGQVAIRVTDLERAVAFYRDRLGLPFLFQYPGLAFFQCGDTRFMLSKPEQPEYDHPGSLLYFKVADIDASYTSLLGRNVTFQGAPHLVHRAPTYELWMALFHDTEGNPLVIMSEKPV